MLEWYGHRLVLILLFMLLAANAAAAGRGFLVVVRDRGYVGNQEVEAMLAGLESDHPVELLLIGANRQGVENGYADYIAAARAALANRGVDEVVAIPLFVSAENHLLTGFRAKIEAAMAPMSVVWAPALGASYLAEEIVLDRIRAAGDASDFERLVLLVSGAVDAESASRRRAMGDRLLDRIDPQLADLGFSKHDTVVTYAGGAEESAADAAEEQAKATIRAAAADGPVLLVPFTIGIKYTPHMSLKAALEYRFKAAGLVIAESLLPHPAARTWLKRTINAHVPASEKTIGIIVMAHGATAPYNDAVIAAMPDLARQYPLAFAFGMASPKTIAGAVRQLEDAGVRHAVFLRLFPRPYPFRAKSDFILGLRREPPAGRGGIPERVRTAIRFVTLGDYQDDPLIGDILRNRILEVSADPGRESVLLLSHGLRDDAANAAALAIDKRHIARIQASVATPFRGMRAMALREDWPEKRAAAVRRIRDYVRTASDDGRALVIANRLYGAGPYARYLEGLDYVANGRGLLTHPAFSQWIETSLEKGIERLKASKAGGRAARTRLSRP